VNIIIAIIHHSKFYLHLAKCLVKKYKLFQYSSRQTHHHHLDTFIKFDTPEIPIRRIILIPNNQTKVFVGQSSKRFAHIKDFLIKNIKIQTVCFLKQIFQIFN